MAQQQSSSGIVAGASTILGLGLVWMTVATNFPSQEELSSTAVPADARPSVSSSSSVSALPMLDLTILTSPPAPSKQARSRQDDDRLRDPKVESPVVVRLDPRVLQASRLKCEAEIEQLCPDFPEGSVRMGCLEQRVKQLQPLCQSQMHERFVKWREDRSRLIAACDDDAKRFCRAVKPGNGQILQCLQLHAQEVSDRCYQTLPKGTVYFK